MEHPEAVIRQAVFNPKVKTYIFIVVLFYLVVSFIGWVVVPFWLLGLGQWFSNKFFGTLQCTLTDRNLSFSKGFIVHIEKTIPLENIQDLSFIGGPLLRSFGLTMIKVETAGGGGSHHQNNMMSMIGIEGAEQFKQAILHQREHIIRMLRQQPAPANANVNDATLLSEIRDELVAIRKTLQEKP